MDSTSAFVSLTGSFIIGITAVDLDDGPNGTVLYSIVNGSDAFQIDSQSGVVTAKRTLSGGSLCSPSSSSSYVFYVRASDQVSILLSIRVVLSSVL